MFLSPGLGEILRLIALAGDVLIRGGRGGLIGIDVKDDVDLIVFCILKGTVVGFNSYQITMVKTFPNKISTILCIIPKLEWNKNN